METLRHIWPYLLGAAAGLLLALIVAVAVQGAVAAEDANLTPEVPTHTDVPCGIPTHVTIPEDTEHITYEGFETTYGYYKVVATARDHSAVLNLPEGSFYRSTPIAPYRAEHLTQIVEPCRDADPVTPIQPEETTQPEPPAAVPEENTQCGER